MNKNLLLGFAAIVLASAPAVQASVSDTEGSQQLTTVPEGAAKVRPHAVTIASIPRRPGCGNPAMMLPHCRN